MAVISFKCPNCDGELIFDPATQDYKCEYCATKFTQAQLDAMQPAEGKEEVVSDVAEENGEETKEQTKQQNDTEDTEQTGAVSYSCPSCGAEIVTDATTAATFCYYCHNPVVLGGRLEGKFLPNRIIPFKITKSEAEKGFLEYVGKKKFVPKAFFNKKQIETMTGVYFPYWLYDVDLEGNVQGDAHKMRVWRTGKEEYTETKYFHVLREGEVSLKNLTENALTKANAKLANGVMPYQFEEMKEFTMGYLSGFQAERRDIEQAAVAAKMQCEMRESAEQLMQETIKGYDYVSLKSTNFLPKQENWFYCLLPVWTITYKGRDGKIYYYSMNGQTGTVCGELPIDYKKLALTALITGAVVFAIGLIGGFFL